MSGTSGTLSAVKRSWLTHTIYVHAITVCFFPCRFNQWVLCEASAMILAGTNLSGVKQSKISKFLS